MDKELKNLSPAEFAEKISYGFWKPVKHLEYINSYLVDLFDDKFFKLMINLPPRHGKSEFISKYLPAWHLQKYPDKRIILTSYGNNFSASWGKQVLALIDEVDNIELDKRARSSRDFRVKDSFGGMLCVGAGGPLTGRGGDLIIIDDPVKNDKEANSQQIRENLWDWYRSTIFTRLEPGGKMIFIMTRWHHDDLCGRILNSEEAASWKLIKLPAIAEKDDPLRNEGESLWKDRYNLEQLLERKRTMGAHWFNALYQQSPTSKDGDVFDVKNFKYFEVYDQLFVLLDGERKKSFLKDNINIYATADLAASKSEMADYTVIMTFGVTKNNQILVMDVLRKKFKAADHFNLMANYYHKWKPMLIGIESVQYQISLTEQLSGAGFPVKKLKATRDKVTRALAISAKMEMGEVYFLRNAPWLGELEKELLEFPHSKHDDQVDAFAYIMQLVAPGAGNQPISKKKNNSITKSF